MRGMKIRIKGVLEMTTDENINKEIFRFELTIAPSFILDEKTAPRRFS